MTQEERDIILRYAAGEISANRAATLLGSSASVADVIAMLHQLGLPPPLPPPEAQAEELARAWRVLGLDHARVRQNQSTP